MGASIQLKEPVFGQQHVNLDTVVKTLEQVIAKDEMIKNDDKSETEVIAQYEEHTINIQGNDFTIAKSPLSDFGKDQQL